MVSAVLKFRTNSSNYRSDVDNEDNADDKIVCCEDVAFFLIFAKDIRPGAQLFEVYCGLHFNLGWLVLHNATTKVYISCYAKFWEYVCTHALLCTNVFEVWGMPQKESCTTLESDVFDIDTVKNVMATEATIKIYLCVRCSAEL